MKKIGIVADNHKVDRFRAKLKKEGLQWDEHPFGTENTSLHVNCEDDDFYATRQKVSKICHEVEMHFKRSN